MNTANDITPYLGTLLNFRHDLHANPELRYEENRTADKIAAYLQALGLPLHRGLGKTGVVATIYGKGRSKDNPGRSIGIRADMDALPVQETTGAAHASCVPGKMHACGHDGHTTMLLGAATLLAKNPNFDGTVHLIFQPAEEGGAGAKAMMDDGLFQLFPCDAVFALHNWPSLPQGQMAVRVGPIMASTLRFEIRVRGKGGPGTHNGLRSIVQCTGSGDFPRIRVGMGAPPPQWDLADWVLGKFSDEAARKIAFDAYMLAAEAALCWAEHGIDLAMNRYNKRHAE